MRERDRVDTVDALGEILQVVRKGKLCLLLGFLFRADLQVELELENMLKVLASNMVVVGNKGNDQRRIILVQDTIVWWKKGRECPESSSSQRSTKLQ